TWFKNKNDDGVTQPEFSQDGIPLVTIGLIATVIECCLDEWQSGKHVDVPFAAAQYHNKFNVHMKTLLSFKAKTQDADIIPRLCNHMLKKARKHAKVKDGTAPRVVELDDNDIAAAKKEWENMELSDPDDEDKD
ncbi:hypothetical protein C0991_010683, partial [Blastosporella zonata]